MESLDVNVPKFDFTVSTKTPIEDILELLKLLKPEWITDQIQTEKMKGGVINQMYKCYQSGNPDDAVTTRVFYVPEIQDEELSKAFDRTREIKNLIKLSPTGYGPKLQCLFANGLCYQYIPGDVLTPENIREKEIIHHITKVLAKMHTLPPVDWESDINIQQFSKMMDNYPPDLKDPEKTNRLLKFIPDKEAALNEFLQIFPRRQEFRSPKVYCHNDSKAQNFIWNEKTKILHIIDLEHCKMNNQGCEIGSHFYAYTDVENPKLGCLPDRDYQLKWIRIYLKHYYEELGLNPEEAITEKEVETLYVEANITVQSLRLFFGLGCLFWIANGMFDFFEFCMVLLEEYFQNKDFIRNLRLPD